MKIKRIFELIKRVVYILNGKQRLLCIIVLILTIIGALLECLGVSIILPLVNVILSPAKLMNNATMNRIVPIDKWGYECLVIAIIGFVICIYILKNIFFIFLSWFRIKFACKIQREVAIRIMKSYMSRGYQYFLNTNYGEISRSISGDSVSVNAVLSAGFRFLSDLLAIILICIYMLFTDVLLSISVIVMSLICVLLIYFVFRRSMQKSGEDYRYYSARSWQAMYQAFQGIKDVLVLRKQRYFIKEYEDNMTRVQIAQCKSTVGAESPAYIIEGLCVSGIMIIVAYKTLLGTNGEAFIATLAAFAIGAFRILPSLGRISISINQVLSNTSGIDAVYDDIKEAEKYVVLHPEVKITEGEFENEHSSSKKNFRSVVCLNNIHFTYEKGVDEVLNGVNLELRKGQAIGIKGTSGAGKSTLVDILLGLLIPQEGYVSIDGYNIIDDPDNWSNVIGYVPQSIFLSDGSIRENVAFGCKREEIDDVDVMEALDRAELKDFVESLPDGLDTFVGDRGIRLSGGQRQRIAIARALYHKPDILILDEATSALDNETEATIMEAIESLQGTITMVIVAHRLTTIKKCDLVYEVINGKLVEVDTACLQ